jgi:hypothetical protein
MHIKRAWEKKRKTTYQTYCTYNYVLLSTIQTVIFNSNFDTQTKQDLLKTLS